MGYRTSDDFVMAYRMDPVERIAAIKAGIPAAAVSELATAMGRPSSWVAGRLGLSPATVGRKLRENRRLSKEQGEAILGLARLIGQVEAMVRECGEPQGFNVPAWLGDWIDRPLTALGGQPPAYYLDTAEGRLLVSGLLETARSGAYT